MTCHNHDKVMISTLSDVLLNPDAANNLMDAVEKGGQDMASLIKSCLSL